MSVTCRLAPSSPPPSGGGGAGVGSLAADALFPASPSLLTLPNSHRTFHDVGIRGSLQSLAPAFSSRESRSSERGSGVDKRARSREVSSRGRRSRSSYRSRLSGRERGGRSSSASRSSRGRSCCERSRSLTATALSVEALGRVVPGLDPRSDIGHDVTALGVSGRGLLTATAPAVSLRVPLPVGEVGARELALLLQTPFFPLLLVC